MTHKLLGIVLLSLSVICFSCKKDKDDDCSNEPKAEAYLTDVFEFYVMDGGSGDGFCGPFIVATLDSAKSTLTYFKAIDLPLGISFSLNTYYKGKFKVHPEQYKCMDGWGDPLPGQLPRTIYPNFVNIISWEKK
jgi:hypothetical protein